ncbi:unnamed protein product [Agarophyton chilense]
MIQSVPCELGGRAGTTCLMPSPHSGEAETVSSGADIPACLRISPKLLDDVSTTEDPEYKNGRHGYEFGSPIAKRACLEQNREIPGETTVGRTKEKEVERMNVLPPTSATFMASSHFQDIISVSSGESDIIFVRSLSESLEQISMDESGDRSADLESVFGILPSYHDSSEEEEGTSEESYSNCILGTSFNGTVTAYSPTSGKILATFPLERDFPPSGAREQAPAIERFLKMERIDSIGGSKQLLVIQNNDRDTVAISSFDYQRNAHRSLSLFNDKVSGIVKNCGAMPLILECVSCASASKGIDEISMYEGDSP